VSSVDARLGGAKTNCRCHRIYDEKIAKFDRELEQLTGPEPTHPELLRQLDCLQRHRDKKIHYEHTLFQYRLQSLMSRSLSDRASIHSTYFQRIRDTRERHSTAVSKQFYAIQHDRFKTEELGAHHYIPFPARRSQQISQQAAYNQEVSVMAGVAKYVGFPAAPSLSAARGTEIDDDFDKMGVSWFLYCFSFWLL
jgi:Sds3-like